MKKSMNDIHGPSVERRSGRGILFVIALCFSLGTALESFAQHVDLRPRFVPGSVMYYRTSKEMKQGVVSAGEATTSTLTTENGVGLRVVERHPGGLVDVEYTILYMRIDGGPPGKEQHLDTRKPQSNVFDASALVLAEVINRPIVLRLTDAGVLKEVLHHEIIVRSLPPNVRDIFSPESLGQQCLSFFPMQAAPEHVAIATEWTDRVSRPSPFGGRLEDNTRCVLKSIDSDKGIAQVTTKTETKLLAGDGSAPLLVQLEKAENVGEIAWSVKEGQLIRSYTQAETVFKSIAPDGSGQAVAVVRMLGTTTTERITLEEMRLKGDKGQGG